MPYVNMQDPAPKQEYEGLYFVHSMFHTIQGEGPFSGEAALFIRLEGCNLQCPFCDTDYTTKDRAMVGTAVQIIDQVDLLIGDAATKLVVISGGEPFRQDITDLCKELMAAGYRVQIETNGTMKPSKAFREHFENNFGIAIVVSPKAQTVHPWIVDHAICFKYVLSHDSIDPEDGLPLTVLGRKSQRVARPPARMKGTMIYISPADMGDDTFATRLNTILVFKNAQKFGYRLQLQIHKYVGVE